MENNAMADWAAAMQQAGQNYLALSRQKQVRDQQLADDARDRARYEQDREYARGAALTDAQKRTDIETEAQLKRTKALTREAQRNAYLSAGGKDVDKKTDEQIIGETPDLIAKQQAQMAITKAAAEDDLKTQAEVQGFANQIDNAQIIINKRSKLEAERNAIDPDGKAASIVGEMNDRAMEQARVVAANIQKIKTSKAFKNEGERAEAAYRELSGDTNLMVLQPKLTSTIVGKGKGDKITFNYDEAIAQLGNPASAVAFMQSSGRVDPKLEAKLAGLQSQASMYGERFDATRYKQLSQELLINDAAMMHLQLDPNIPNLADQPIVQTMLARGNSIKDEALRRTSGVDRIQGVLANAAEQRQLNTDLSPTGGVSPRYLSPPTEFTGETSMPSNAPAATQTPVQPAPTAASSGASAPAYLAPQPPAQQFVPSSAETQAAAGTQYRTPGDVNRARNTDAISDTVSHIITPVAKPVPTGNMFFNRYDYTDLPTLASRIKALPENDPAAPRRVSLMNQYLSAARLRNEPIDPYVAKAASALSASGYLSPQPQSP